MSLDNRLEPPQLEFDFMKKENPPFLRRFVRTVAIGVGGVAGLYAVVVGGSLVLAAATGSEIVHPWTPPRVVVASHAISIEPWGYTRPHLTKFFSGEINIKKFVADHGWTLYFWESAYELIGSNNGNPDIETVFYGGREYNRKNDLAKHPDIFAWANKESKKVLAGYRPYLQTQRDIF